MRIKAVLFDFDGVILESADIKTETFHKLFEEDYPELCGEMLKYHLEHQGVSRFTKFRYFYENVIKKEYTVEVEKELGKRFQEMALADILSAPFVPGAFEFLKSNFENYLFFVASGTEENELKWIAEKRGVKPFFYEMHGGHKSKTEIGKDILTRYNISRDEIIFVGDAESDLIASEQLGIPFIARIASSDNSLNRCKYTINDLYGLKQKMNDIEREF